MATVPLFCLDGSVSPHHLSAMNVTMKSEDEEKKRGHALGVMACPIESTKSPMNVMPGSYVIMRL